MKMNSDNTLFRRMSIRGITDLYSRGDLSPSEVASICLRQMDLQNPKYKAMVAYDPRNVMAQAMDCERRLRDGGVARKLAGIPVGVKDIFNTIDLPTQMGSPLWKDFTPGNDARTVFNLKRAGGIVAGKTETAEFAVHTLGDAALNPHDVARTPGTSSSGSAIGISLGLFPAALGTQTAGSIIRPASFCGVYGCKPSFGLIPRTGTLKTTDSLDTIGFFTLHAEDLIRVFDVLRVHGLDYPISHRALSDPQRQMKSTDRPWKVLLAKTHTWKEAPDYAKDSLAHFAARLASSDGIEVAEEDLPMEMEMSHEVHAAIYNKTLAYYFKEEFKRCELVSPIMNDLIRQGQELPLDKYLWALRTQEMLCRRMDAMMSQYDVLISLSTAGEAPLRHEIEKPDPALMWTLTHLPVVGVPVFRSPKGLPFGVQIAARRYSDYRLFSFVEYLVERQLAPKAAMPVETEIF